MHKKKKPQKLFSTFGASSLLSVKTSPWKTAQKISIFQGIKQWTKFCQIWASNSYRKSWRMFQHSNDFLSYFVMKWKVAVYMQVCNANLADKKADNILAAFLSSLLNKNLYIFYHEMRFYTVLCVRISAWMKRRRTKESTKEYLFFTLQQLRLQFQQVRLLVKQQLQNNCGQALKQSTFHKLNWRLQSLKCGRGSR